MWSTKSITLLNKAVDDREAIIHVSKPKRSVFLRMANSQEIISILQAFDDEVKVVERLSSGVRQPLGERGWDRFRNIRLLLRVGFTEGEAQSHYVIGIRSGSAMLSSVLHDLIGEECLAHATSR